MAQVFIKIYANPQHTFQIIMYINKLLYDPFGQKVELYMNNV